MMKFEKTAEIGDLIKAFDFQPNPNHADSYIVGKVTDKGMSASGYLAYTIDVIHRVMSGKVIAQVNNTSYVPFECGFMEYDERVSKI
jgi:hypothetical protein|tara:strand:- start:81 stop:341 length:261 start_codon:yes stop_codon:yes gene_type:complete